MQVTGMQVEFFTNNIKSPFLTSMFWCIQLMTDGIQQYQSENTEPGFELAALMNTFSFFTLMAECNFAGLYLSYPGKKQALHVF